MEYSSIAGFLAGTVINLSHSYAILGLDDITDRLVLYALGRCRNGDGPVMDHDRGVLSLNMARTGT